MWTSDYVFLCMDVWILAILLEDEWCTKNQKRYECMNQHVW